MKGDDKLNEDNCPPRKIKCTFKFPPLTLPFIGLIAVNVRCKSSLVVCLMFSVARGHSSSQTGHYWLVNVYYVRVVHTILVII